MLSKNNVGSQCALLTAGFIIGIYNLRYKNNSYGKEEKVLHSYPCKDTKKFNVTKLQKDRSIHVISILLWRQVKLKVDLEEYVDVPCKYWKMVVAEHYERAMNPLIRHGIVQRLNSYSTSFHQCKKYRVNPFYMEGESKKVYYDHEKSKKQKDNSVVCKMTRKVIRELKLDKVAAGQFIESITERPQVLARLNINDEVIEGKNLYVLTRRDSKAKYRGLFLSKARALDYALATGRHLIQDKQRIIIDSLEHYVKRKQKHIRYSYLTHVEKICHKEVYANRNKTNNRLDSNITTIPSVLIPFFRLDGESLVGLDLSNSQFVILASMIEQGVFEESIEIARKEVLRKRQKKLTPSISNKNTTKVIIIKTSKDYKKVVNGERYEVKGRYRGDKELTVIKRLKEEGCSYMCANSKVDKDDKVGLTHWLPVDLVRFIKLAKNGGLYEYIRDYVGLPLGDKGRKQAKQMMFEICFSKHNNNTAAKKRLRAIFPHLVEMIDAYKKVHGNNQFAIALQKRESRIFIDGILAKLFKLGFKVLSKHDSILCKESERGAVEQLMKDELDEVLGEYHLKTEYASIPYL